MPEPTPAAETTAAVPSPCISVCRMDAAHGLCTGCWRTLDEIAAWSTWGDDDKRTVWQLIAQRRIAHPTFALPPAP